MTARESLEEAVQTALVAHRATGNQDGQFVCPACGAQVNLLARWDGQGFIASCERGCFRMSTFGR